MEVIPLSTSGEGPHVRLPYLPYQKKAALGWGCVLVWVYGSCSRIHHLRATYQRGVSLVPAIDAREVTRRTALGGMTSIGLPGWHTRGGRNGWRCRQWMGVQLPHDSARLSSCLASYW